MFSFFLFIALKIGNLEKNVQNLKVQLAGAHGNHKEAMDQVDCWGFFLRFKSLSVLIVFTCLIAQRSKNHNFV